MSDPPELTAITNLVFAINKAKQKKSPFLIAQKNQLINAI